jgi:alpha-tubulin suppressor-like RCC1 family protein
MKALIEACDEFAANAAKGGDADSLAASLEKIRAELNRENREDPWTLPAALTLLTAAARKDDCAFAGFLKKYKLGETELPETAKRMSDIVDIVKLTETVKASDGSLDMIKAALDELKGKEKETLEALEKKFAVPAKHCMRVVAAGSSRFGQCDVSGWEDIVSITAGNSHTIGLREDGTVIAVGDNQFGQCNVSGWKNILSVTAGDFYTVGLGKSGRTVAVGDKDNSKCNVYSFPNDVVAIATGSVHTVILRKNGTVMAVGDRYAYEGISEWKNIAAITAGFFYTVGVREDGTVVAATDMASLGEIRRATDISGWENIVGISARDKHTLGLRKDGTVVSAGESDYMQRGISDWKNIVAVSAGVSHAVGLRDDGTVVAVGDNDSGQCDVSEWEDITAISAGGGHTIGLQKVLA